jgi:hypothetical protein
MQKVKAPNGQMLTPALYATMWRLGVVEESNEQGSWSNWSVEKVGLVQSRELFQEAKALRESVASGAVKAAADPDRQGSGGGGSSHNNSGIPFLDQTLAAGLRPRQHLIFGEANVNRATIS